MESRYTGPVINKGVKFVKTRIFTAVIAAGLLAAAAPAYAGSCPKHMKAIDAYLEMNKDVPADKLAQVKALRMQGEADHKAGKHAESVKALTDAEKMLGIK